MDTEAMGAASGRELAQKDDFIAYFFISDVVIFYSGQFVFQFIQLMIVRGKKCLGRVGRGVEVFCDAPGDRYPVIGGSPSSDLIPHAHAARSVLNSSSRPSFNTGLL